MKVDPTVLVVAAIGVMAAVAILCFVVVPVVWQNVVLRRYLTAAWGRDYSFGGKSYADSLLPPGFKSPMK